MYYYGVVVEKNIANAVEWWEKAADAGNDQALCYLALLYNEGKRVPQDYNKSFEYWERAAQRGVEQSYLFLGDMYRMGQGVKRNYKEAFKWFEKGAEYDERCSFSLAKMYYEGQGVKRNYDMAFKIWNGLEDKEHYYVQQMMGDCYYEGRGVERDLYKAKEHYGKCLELIEANGVSVYNADKAEKKIQSIKKRYI